MEMETFIFKSFQKMKEVTEEHQKSVWQTAAGSVAGRQTAETFTVHSLYLLSSFYALYYVCSLIFLLPLHVCLFFCYSYLIPQCLHLCFRKKLQMVG